MEKYSLEQVPLEHRERIYNALPQGAITWIAEKCGVCRQVVFNQLRTKTREKKLRADVWGAAIECMQEVHSQTAELVEQYGRSE